MMPARIAATPPEDQIKDTIGSGPFRFARDEWKPGEQVEYLRNSDYIPRDEAPTGPPAAEGVSRQGDLGAIPPTPGMRRRTSRRVGWIGGKNHRWTSYPSWNRSGSADVSHRPSRQQAGQAELASPALQQQEAREALLHTMTK